MSRASRLFGESQENCHIRIYRDAPHGWLNDTMPGRYRKEAANDAWSLMMAFLKNCFAGGWDRNRIFCTYESDYSSQLRFHQECSHGIVERFRENELGNNGQFLSRALTVVCALMISLVGNPAPAAERVTIATPSRGLFEFPVVVAMRKGFLQETKGSTSIRFKCSRPLGSRR